MAHALDFQRGKAAFVSLKQEAWHGLGKVVENQMTVAEAIKFAELDFLVEKAPNIHRIQTGINPENGQPIFQDQITGKSFFTYRTDTNFVLGDRLGATYQVIQNEEALGVCDALVQEGGLIIETAGSLHDGRTVFMCCRVPEPIKVLGQDEVKQYVMIAAGHDGGTPILAYFTNVRVVCNNTLQMSLGDATQKHSIRHTRSAKSKLDEALKIMGLQSKNQIAAQAAFDRMAQTKFSQEQFWNFLGNVFFTGEEIKALQSGKKPAEAISTRKQNIVNDVIAFANNGIGQAEAGENTAWWAYNAVTGYYSNAPYDDPNDRMERLMWGGASLTMEKALAFAENPAKIQNLKSKSTSGIVWN